MDPVQKAVINHTFGVPQPLKKKQIISCNICHLRFNSTVRKCLFYVVFGGKHKSNLYQKASLATESMSVVLCFLLNTASDTSAPEAPEAVETMGPTAESGCTADSSSTNGEPRSDEDKDVKKSKSHLHCPVCKVTVNSVSQLEAHNSGTKHKMMLEGHSVLPRRRGKVVAARAGCKSKRLGSKGSVGVPSKNFQCEVCEIFVNSETQLSQHMNSRRHKDRLAGKPPKPKFTPHSKIMLKTSSPLPPVCLAFKQLTKSLTTGFLPSPLTPPTLCTVATNPLALRHPVGTTTFIQTPFLGPALFRPAPGPLRAAHTPIIFSPY
uniref:Zinc finger protein 385C n=1 Tax=Sphaeramia orbicularis TaxID=375764 RepID=A0A673BMY4_9TELE